MGLGRWWCSVYKQIKKAIAQHSIQDTLQAFSLGRKLIPMCQSHSRGTRGIAPEKSKMQKTYGPSKDLENRQAPVLQVNARKTEQGWLARAESELVEKHPKKIVSQTCAENTAAYPEEWS